ncbi:phage tail tape measure protein [Labrenzia sp. OB1]|uniref:phage tail tape measure protein n=1 Tax=Labrenzia sp. OB1 TaxID=1561204 RepID=UPI0007B1A573|nr:phage tail tape measure protein [Labrenzia sp. OB1]KZM49443.1 hypothetical protein OA90_15310 [Labrenzia sp. OB1]
MDVSLKLRLDYKDRGARRAKKDLQEIDRAADRLDGSGTRKLGRDLDKISGNARKAATALELPANKMRALNAQKTDRVERELKQLGNAATQAGNRLRTIDRTKFRALHGEVDRATRKVDGLGRRVADQGAVVVPAKRLTGVMGGLETTAGRAFGALAAFAAVDNIVRGLNQLEKGFNSVDDAAARVAVTAEMRDPEVVKAIKAENTRVAMRFGQDTEAVNAARNVFAAANFPVARQNALLMPVGKTAFASGSEPEIIARAVTAAINNLGIKENQVPAFLDQIVKGGKEGEFEIEAMAKYFPELGALYSASGRSGLDASAELVALAQVVRKGAGMEAGAATNLQNLLSKMASPETVKNFEEKGVDLRAVSGRAQEQGTPYILALLDEVQRLTGGNEFAIGELFGDMQAKSALRPLLNNRAFYNQAYAAIRNKSEGIVDLDAGFLENTPKAQSDRRKAALTKSGRTAGSLWGGITNPLIEEFIGWINPAFRRQEESIANTGRLKSVDTGALQLEIEELKGQIENRPESRFGLPDTARLPLELRLKELEWQLQQARQLQGGGEPQSPAPGGVPAPRAKPGTANLERLVPGPQSFREAGDKAGSEFADALTEEAGKATAIADQLKARFSFTATPKINPSFSGADPISHRERGPGRSFKSVPAAPAPALKIQNTFNQVRDPERAAREAQRMQNRAIRTARARALHDTGDFA